MSLVMRAMAKGTVAVVGAGESLHYSTWRELKAVWWDEILQAYTSPNE